MSDTIGLALSGGGFRASAFHLGVLKRLEELDVLPRITRVSTVSGGSITGALYALKCKQHGDGSPGVYAVESLISDMRTVLTSDFRRRALMKDWKTTIRTVASLTTGKVDRVSMVTNTLDDDIYGGAMLSDVPPWLLVNATNILTGKAWRFFHDRAGDFLIGATDKTQSIRLAEAVMASAAFPGLVEPVPFQTRWQDLRGDLLDDRWQKPPTDGSGSFSRWRSDFGHMSGDLTVPLTDGGLYDNEGLEGLRSSKVDYAIYACTAPPEATHESRFRAVTALRLVDILHNRLGDLTRRLAHEMTHAVNPTQAREKLMKLADELSASSDQRSVEIAGELRELAGVGWPPRGIQYKATAPILIRRKELAGNRFAEFDPPFHVAAEHRGLTPKLVDGLARVRTDLDSFSSELIDLLIAQAYFLTDAHVKLAMPEIISTDPPFWDWATRVISDANANESAVEAQLEREAKRRYLLKRRQAR